MNLFKYEYLHTFYIMEIYIFIYGFHQIEVCQDPDVSKIYTFSKVIAES